MMAALRKADAILREAQRAADRIKWKAAEDARRLIAESTEMVLPVKTVYGVMVSSGTQKDWSVVRRRLELSDN